MTSVSTRSAPRARIDASAAWPSPTDLDVPAPAEQARDVLAHVRVVVGHHDAGAAAAVRGHRGAVSDSAGERPVRRPIVGQPPERLLQERQAARGGRHPGGAGADPLGRQMAAALGQRHHEHGPLARLALGPDRPAVQLHELLDQRQADAGALVGAGPHAFDAVEALEQAIDLAGGDADAGVAHDQRDRVAAVLELGR